jgi:hypothetical protein
VDRLHRLLPPVRDLPDDKLFRRIPHDIIEAVEVDGASPPVAWLRIAMPMAAPALVSLATLVFVWTWNNLLVSLVYLGGSPSVAPMPVIIANLIGSQGKAKSCWLQAPSSHSFYRWPSSSHCSATSCAGSRVAEPSTAELATIRAEGSVDRATPLRTGQTMQMPSSACTH